MTMMAHFYNDTILLNTVIKLYINEMTIIHCKGNSMMHWYNDTILQNAMIKLYIVSLYNDNDTQIRK